VLSDDCPATDLGMLASDGSVAIIGDTCMSSNDYENDGDDCFNYGSGGRDDIYQFTVDAPGEWHFDTCGACWDTALMVREETGGGCPGDWLACDGDTCNDCMLESMVHAFLTMGTTYYLVVDGDSAAWCGSYYVMNFLEDPGCTNDAECDDGNECTDDVCDVVVGVCDYILRDGEPCFDDGDECTDDVCWDDTCMHPRLEECPPRGPEVRWQPVDISGAYCKWIDNHEDTPGKPSEVVLLGSIGPEATVTLELHLSGWGDAVGAPELGVYQVTLDWAGYSSGTGDPLGPLGGCCPGDPAGAFFDYSHPHNVFRNLYPPCAPYPALRLITLNYEFGAFACCDSSCAVVDPRTIEYGGTLILEIPQTASGTYTIDFIAPETKTFMNDALGAKINPLTKTAVKIHVIGADPVNCIRFDDDLTFDDWGFVNNSEPVPMNPWYGGNPWAFVAHSGGPDWFMTANWSSVDDGPGIDNISNWMILPETWLEDGMVLSFFTRTPPDSFWPDRLQVRMSLAGSSANVGSTWQSVGDFTELLVDVNPTLALGGYPEEWTQFAVPLSGIGRGTTGRIAFRYYVPDGGPGGTNSNYIGLDTVSLIYPPNPIAPAPELGGQSCTTSADCEGPWLGADCVGGRCYVPKNRYLSIDPTGNVFPVAYQVEVTEAADYPTALGRTWWVDAPVCYDYPNGEPVPGITTCEGADRFGWVSNLGASPVARMWTEVPLHITGCGIAPAVSYEIRASADDGGSFSDPLEIGTAHNPEGLTQSWGDITGGPVEGMPGVWLAPERATNLADVGNAIRTFENRSEDTGFPPRVWVDVEINQVINLADIQFIITAFEGTAYADLNLPLIGVDPTDCP
jgi:hypothetical protein